MDIKRIQKVKDLQKRSNDADRAAKWTEIESGNDPRIAIRRQLQQAWSELTPEETNNLCNEYGY